MPKKKIKQLPSIVKDMISDSAPQSLPSASNTILSKYYHSISDLPLSKFIDVVVDNNIYALVITGKPTDDELLQAWSDVQIQYADAIKDEDTRLLSTLERELNRLKITHSQIIQAIDILKKYYTVQFAKELNRLLQTSFKLDVRLKEDYDNDLKRAFNRSKGIMIAIRVKQRAYDAMQTKLNTSDKKLTREYFQGILITLSDAAGYELRESMSVFKFCDRIRRLNQQNDYNEKLKNKK